jgi:putative oxidoreductase
MLAFISIGRLLFSLLFIFLGASKLLDIAGTTEIAGKVVIPALLTDYTTQLEGLAGGMKFAQMLAIAAGATQLVCGILIALNFGARYFALILVIYLLGVEYYYHDFWNQSGAEGRASLVQALTDLSLIGGLLVIAGIGRGPRKAESSALDV